MLDWLYGKKYNDERRILEEAGNSERETAAAKAKRKESFISGDFSSLKEEHVDAISDFAAKCMHELGMDEEEALTFIYDNKGNLESAFKAEKLMRKMKK